MIGLSFMVFVIYKRFKNKWLGISVAKVFPGIGPVRKAPDPSRRQRDKFRGDVLTYMQVLLPYVRDSHFFGLNLFGNTWQGN